MARLTYSAFYCLLIPLILLRMLWRSRREPGYRRRWKERFGLFEAPGLERPIWIHAVSVGELASVGPLLDRLLARGGQPLVVTTTTPGASRLVRQRYGERVFHVYLPLDLPCCVNQFLRRVQPGQLVLVEKELWPNLLHFCAAAGCSISLVNARMSAASASRYRKLPALVRPMLQGLSHVAAQTTEDAAQLCSLGVAPSRIEVCGNLKFDLRVDDSLRDSLQALRRRWNVDARPVVLAASIHPEEEALVLDALVAVLETHSNALFILVPRHPQRAVEIMKRCLSAGFSPQLYSACNAPGSDCHSLVVDTLGDMMLLLGLAHVAVMGGSFAGRGGHNLAEPAAWAVPLLSGPSLENFPQIRDVLLEVGTLRVCNNEGSLATGLLDLLGDEALRTELGTAGLQALARESGASARVLELLLGGVG